MMSLDNKPLYSGGCQCGAVRFHIEGALGEPSVCHCRMCQKAFGAFYAPLVSARGAKLPWTRGEPKRFQSSNHVRRGFCENCGTPLTYEALDGIALAIGAFDDPSGLAPRVQWGTEGKLPFVDDVPNQPGHDTMEDLQLSPFLDDIVPTSIPTTIPTNGRRPRAFQSERYAAQLLS